MGAACQGWRVSPVPLGDRARAMAGREAGHSNHVGELAPGTGNDSMDEEQPVKGRESPHKTFTHEVTPLF